MHKNNSKLKNGPPAFEGRLIKQQRISAKDTDAGWNYLLTSIVTQDYINNVTTTETVDYDQIGNPTSYRGATLAFNGRQLTSYTKGSTSISYAYDASGLRASKTVNGQTTIYQYVGDKLYYEQRPDGSKLYYFYDSYGKLSYIYRHVGQSKVAYKVVTNAQGDVIALYNFAGNQLMASYSYDAWGNLVAVTDANGNEITSQTHIAFINPIRYRGYYYDSEIGMYYLQSRYYDPNTGRFINSDGYIFIGIENHLGLNTYCYCNNSPVVREDSTGTSCGYAIPQDPVYVFLQELGKAIGIIAPTYTSCGMMAVADGPLPFGDLLGIAFAGVTTVGVIGYSVYKTFDQSPTKSVPIAEEKDIVKDTPKPPTCDYIYRYNGFSAGNFVPSDVDVRMYPKTGKGLSFSTVYRAGAVKISVDELQKTGVLYVVYDGGTHVSVHPIGGTLQEWHDCGVMSVWTQAVYEAALRS